MSRPPGDGLDQTFALLFSTGKRFSSVFGSNRCISSGSNVKCAVPDLDRQDYVILNSTVNVPKAIDVLYPYERIHCMLDNDDTGYKATRAIEL